MVINSHKGPYTVLFDENGLGNIASTVPERAFLVVDQNVANLYAASLGEVLEGRSVLVIEATESNKSLDKFTAYVERLLDGGMRRGHVLVALGGGIIQDITCFLAATLLRGVDWFFYPSTLLAQADSCIGSKSSINVGRTKNILGTFTPPKKVIVCPHLLSTLKDEDIRSGIGEMLKVHVIDGPASFDKIAADYDQLLTDSAILANYVRRSLEIKKAFIEEDEFDRGPRNIMNYGHSFGHAIESATDFAIPHGIGVTIGMDMANYVSVRLNLMGRDHYDRMHPVLSSNYAQFQSVEVPLEAFFNALSKDKKNVDTRLSLILPGASARVSRGFYEKDETFVSVCKEYLAKELSE
jgi:3-dehydroquinate synthase